MERIIVHWTAGGNRASDVDKQHYHRLVEWDGTIVAGKHEVADNIVTSDGDYAAHTRNLNTGSIGVALCGMRGAKEHPFTAGPSPLTEKQFRTACILIADLCRQYSIPVTPETVLTHAEVQPTLGVIQRGKWDITRLPFKPNIVGAFAVGNYMRDMVRDILGHDAPAMNRPTLRIGNRAPMSDVKTLQQDLKALGFHSGAVDGMFGRRTRASVMALQAEHGLVVDGVVGPATWAALSASEPLPVRAITEAELRERGSRTIAAADSGEKQVKAAGAGVGALGVVQMGQDWLNTVTSAGGPLDKAQEILVSNWPILLVIGIGLVAYFHGPKIMQAIKDIRVRAHITGANLER